MRFHRTGKLSIIFLIAFAFIVLVNAKENCGIFEAEAGHYVSLTVLQNDQASGGAYLAMKNSGSVKWEVMLPDSGWYNLKIRYRSPQGEKENTLFINQVKRRTGFGWAPEWTDLVKPVVLRAGQNVIELKSNWGWIDIDCLTFEKIDLQPAITPHKNIFYKILPRDIYIKINAYGRAIGSVTAGEKAITFSKEVFPYEEDAWTIKLEARSLLKLEEGLQVVRVNFTSGESVQFELQVMNRREPADLTIIAPDVSHGNAVLFLLPNGETLLVDCGQSFIRDEVIIPLLEKNGIKHLNYFVLTHYHDDHDSGDKGQTIRERFKPDYFRDYRDFEAGDEMEIGGVRLKVLNAFADGSDENKRSLAFQLIYNGFVYRHDADIYAINQRKIMERFPADSLAQVYFANHHFHGSTDEEYLRIMNPDVVLIQAEQAIYARSAYTKIYRKYFVEWMKKNRQKIVESLPAIEVGTTVIRINSGEDWTYETYKDCAAPFIPFLAQNEALLDAEVQFRRESAALRERIERYRHIIENELHFAPQSGDILSATFFLQLENLQKMAQNPIRNATDLKRTEAELSEMIEWIKNGKDYFQEKRGRVKIGYLSEIDSTCQPFDLMIPNHFNQKKSYGLLIYLHGKEDQIQKYRNLLWANEDPGLDELGVFKVAVYGRRNCWYLGAGEVDIFRVIQEICNLYPIDTTRIYLMGASMGGYGSWRLGLNYADRFAAISPICGRTTTGEDFYGETISPLSYVENAMHLPVRFYHGDIDPVIPVTDSRQMAQRLKQMRYEHVYTEFKDVKHDSWNAARADKQRLPYLTKFKLDPYPKAIHHKCFYLKYGKSYWAEIIRKTKWHNYATVDAKIQKGNKIKVVTDNVAEIRLNFNHPELNRQKMIVVTLNKQVLKSEASSGWSIFYQDNDGQWHAGSAPSEGLCKRKCAEGPWIDAEFEPFVIVYGTHESNSADRLHEFGHKLQEYYARFDMRPVLIPDSLVNDEKYRGYNLHLLGTPADNKYMAQIQAQLPVKIDSSGFILGDKYLFAECGLRMIYPNPLNPERYVRIDLLPSVNPDYGFLDETVADYLIYTIKDNKYQVLAKDFFNNDWQIGK